MADPRTVGGFLASLGTIAFLIWIFLGTGIGVGAGLANVPWWIWWVIAFVFIFWLLRKR